MQTSFIITFIGDDRPGLVEALAGVIERCGGNWQESHLSQLGGKFAGLVLVSLPGERGAELEEALRTLHESGLSVRVTPAAGTSGPAEGGRTVQLSLIGPDRPGIVSEVSRALAQRQINVVELESKVSSAPMSAELIFNARLEASIPEAVSLSDLHDSLEEIANAMTLEIDLD